MRCALVFVAVTACGRVNFEAVGAVDATDADAVDAPHVGNPNIVVLGTRGAFTTVQFDAWLASHATTETMITDTSFDDSTFITTDLIVLLDSAKVYSQAESMAIANVVGRGGALIAVTGYEDPFDLDGFNAVMGVFGIQAQLTSDKNGPVTAFASHPITAGLTSLPFVGGYELTSTAPAATIVGHINATPVAVALDYQRGRLVAWGDDFVTFDSDRDAEVVRFWDNALAWVWPTQ